MRWNTLKYLFKEGIIGLWKNRTMAIASAGTIILCLLILSMSYSISTNIDYVLKQVENKFGITSYIEDNISKERLTEITKQVEGISNVAEVKYISKEEALKSFSEGSEDLSIFEDFKEDNPLPASFEILVVDIEGQEQVVEMLNKIPELDTVYLQSETDMFIKLNKLINYVSIAIIICLIVVGLLLMSNTIRLTVYIRRREINIMKYIGATDWFIRLPFLIEGTLIGVMGAILSICVVAGVYDSVFEALMMNLQGVLKEISFVPTATIMRAMIPICLILGAGIGFIGSASAVRKHLKV